MAAGPGQSYSTLPRTKHHTRPQRPPLDRPAENERPHRSPQALTYPATVNHRKIVWPYAISLTVYHLAALLAFVPWLFSWSGVALAVAGLYVFGTLGINLCFHRLLTHRG